MPPHPDSPPAGPQTSGDTKHSEATEEPSAATVPLAADDPSHSQPQHPQEAHDQTNQETSLLDDIFARTRATSEMIKAIARAPQRYVASGRIALPFRGNLAHRITPDVYTCCSVQAQTPVYPSIRHLPENKGEPVSTPYVSHNATVAIKVIATLWPEHVGKICDSLERVRQGLPVTLRTQIFQN